MCFLMQDQILMSFKQVADAAWPEIREPFNTRKVPGKVIIVRLAHMKILEYWGTDRVLPMLCVTLQISDN